MVRRAVLIKLLVGLGVISALVFLFARSLRDARTAAYTTQRRHLQSWTLALDAGSRPNDPLLVLRPAPELASGLFRQVFTRTMESLDAPAAPAVPLVLRGEFDRVLADRLTPDALLAAARGSNLEAAAISLRCLVHRRVSEPGSTRQVYFALADAPSFEQFRRQLGLDSALLSPVLFIAGTGTDFTRWMPVRVDTNAECLAPIETVD